MLHTLLHIAFFLSGLLLGYVIRKYSASKDTISEYKETIKTLQSSFADQTNGFHNRIRELQDEIKNCNKAKPQ